jgi:hypothetical protein
MTSRATLLAISTVGGLSLAAAIGWAYAPILDNGFVWDDGANLIGARASWDRGWSGVAWAFTKTVAGHYQPLTWLSYQLDAVLNGATPRGVHATQIVLHLLVTLAVAVLAALLAKTSRLRGLGALQGIAFPLVAAALFALAPVRVESVAWATERRDLLGALFAIAAVALYLRQAGRDAADPRSLYGVAALAALSALSRAQMSLPFVLLLLDVWPLGRLDQVEGAGARLRALGRLAWEKALLVAIAGASAAAAIWAQAASGALTSVAEHGLLDRVVQAGYGLAFYPIVAFLPKAFGPLLPLYERPSPFTPLALQFLLPAVIAVLALIAIWLWRRRAPALAVACGAYLLLVLPVLGIAQSGIQLVADRYAYLATVPLFLLAAAGVALAFHGAPSRAVRVAIAVLLAALLAANAVATRRQTAVWRDDITLWRHVVAHSESSLGDNNLGQMLLARGESGPALFHLTRCLERTPQYPRPWRAVAAILEAPSWPAGAPPAAEVAPILARALTHQSGSKDARFATALAWIRSGDLAQGEAELRRLLALDPKHDGARLELARIASKRQAPPS